MDFCRMIKPLAISKNRLAEIEAALARASSLISKYSHAEESNSRVDFYASFVRAYRDRADIIVDRITIPACDAAVMIETKRMEGEILEGFSKSIQSCIRACANGFGVDSDNLQAVAYECFFNSIVNYDGSTRFCTYLHVCLKRGLARFCAGQNGLGIPRNIRKMSVSIAHSMRKNRSTFDDAVSELGISSKNAQKAAAAMRVVKNATELEIREEALATTQPSESLDWVTDAVNKANLDGLEKATLDAFLAAPTGSYGLTAGCKTLINPSTGKPYSRTALSLAWKRARIKIAKAMEEAA